MRTFVAKQIFNSCYKTIFATKTITFNRGAPSVSNNQIRFVFNNMTTSNENKILAIHEAEQNLLDIGENGIKLWYQTWGNRSSGIPVLFVHGGPGNCVADYEGINGKFFDKNRFFVIEVDQRGTGKSQPSVRDDFTNMKKYLDISINKMSADFELVREKLGIQKWLVFGGSWGSTLGLHYAQTYPVRCLGLIIRGIFLNTKEEFDAVLIWVFSYMFLVFLGFVH